MKINNFLNLSTLLTVIFVVIIEATPVTAIAQGGLFNRARDLLTSNDNSTVSDSGSNASTSDTSIQSLDASCIENSENASEDENYLRNALAKSVESELSAESGFSQYLVGLCVPSTLEERKTLAEYLLTRGASFDFYMEESLQEMAEYLDDAGVELSIRVESIEADDRFTDSAGFETAELMLGQEHYYSDNANAILPGIAELQAGQREEALRLAGIIRAYALNSTFFNARGLYISEKVIEELPDQVKATLLEGRKNLERTQRDIDSIRETLDAGIGVQNAVSLATNVLDRFRRGGRRNQNTGQSGDSALSRYLQFITFNGEALVRTLNSGIGIIGSLNRDISDVPRLSQQEILSDMARINKEWQLPTEFEDPAAYNNENPMLLDEI